MRGWGVAHLEISADALESWHLEVSDFCFIHLLAQRDDIRGSYVVEQTCGRALKKLAVSRDSRASRAGRGMRGTSAARNALLRDCAFRWEAIQNLRPLHGVRECECTAPY